eukprot:TRINITY_DN136_c0_g1_i2.p1 TRINITY_DN136_c0_g1~~TRINITY_DN136_c0_g1_i2.p1  ORF type:complete len:333 (-),score=66.99 TRINITY_DN136_c0_g1_i2:108-1031(-)
MAPNAQHTEAVRTELEQQQQQEASTSLSVAGEKHSQQRRRGDFDYHIMITTAWYAGGDELIRKNSNSVEEVAQSGGLWGKGTLDIDGDTKLLNLVGRPPSFGRRPNARVLDVSYRAMDGMLVILQPSPYEITLDHWVENLERSFAGENQKYYQKYLEKLHHPILDLYAKQNMSNVLPASNVKIVTFLLLVDDSEFTRMKENGRYYGNFTSVDQSIANIRGEVQKLQKKYKAEIRLFTRLEASNDGNLEEILTQMCRDIDNQKGLTFNQIIPLIQTPPKFEELDIQKKKQEYKPTATKTSFWKKLIRW